MNWTPSDLDPQLEGAIFRILAVPLALAFFWGLALLSGSGFLVVIGFVLSPLVALAWPVWISRRFDTPWLLVLAIAAGALAAFLIVQGALNFIVTISDH